MNVSIIGPEGSGKTTLAFTLAKRAAFGRPVYVVGKLKTDFTPLELKNFDKPKNAVVIVDDANAFMEHYDLMKEENNLKEPVIMARHNNRLNIFVFHSIDDAVKFFFRQSRYIYVSEKYRDKSYQNNKFIKGITPEVIGRAPYLFNRFKRY